MEEVADEDSHHLQGLKISDPILIGPEEAADNEPASDTEDEVFLEIVQEFTRERFPKGPKFDTLGVDPSLPSILPQEQMDDLNDTKRSGRTPVRIFWAEHPIISLH
jgi:hypothetical protein